ncbi:MAG: zf-HC2 domain-containing protein [Acidobacteria bacterium]|nr:zf-HC2 domain-containing protein [Acidobacteriota bacterium]
MNCERAAALLPLYAAGDLGGARGDEVEAHVAACGDCRKVAGEFRESRALLFEAFETPEFGAEFYANIRGSVLEKISRDREPSTPSFVAALFGRRAAYATAFAVALFVLALALQHFRGGVRETTTPLASGGQIADAPQQEQRRGSEAPSQQNAEKNEPTPNPTRTAAAPRRESTRRAAPDRRREPVLNTVAHDDESATVAQATPSVDGTRGASESASPATAAPEVSRIEIQTADPSIRIIWLAPRKSEAPDPNEPKNENGERK